MKVLCIVSLLLLAAPFPWAQSSPPLDQSNFTKSPNEHTIQQIEDPFHVRTIAGTITTARGEGGRTDVLLEIQGPGDDLTIRHALTDKHGHFKISKMPEGNYRFKATFFGFQPVTGTIIVSKHAPQVSEIKIEMQLGT
jgi:hypothetical protein